MKILFNSLETAQFVAFQVQGKWDGCNGIELASVDEAALRCAVSLVGGEYCFEGELCVTHINFSPFSPTKQWIVTIILALGLGSLIGILALLTLTIFPTLNATLVGAIFWGIGIALGFNLYEERHLKLSKKMPSYELFILELILAVRTIIRGRN